MASMLAPTPEEVKMGLVLWFVGVWVLASVILVPIAARRRREEDPAIWAFAALFFSPLLVLLAFAAMPQQPERAAERKPEWMP